MKKILLLVTAFVVLNPVLQVVASVEDMYSDIKTVINDPLTGKNDNQRLNNVREALKTLKYRKKSMEGSIIYLHSPESYSKFVSLFLGMLTGIVGGLGVLNYVNGTMQLIEVVGIGTACTSISLFLNYESKIKLYYIKKKIKEVNEVITRLEAMEKALIKKIQDTQDLACITAG
jgi:hypothetical protein